MYIYHNINDMIGNEYKLFQYIEHEYGVIDAL